MSPAFCFFPENWFHVENFDGFEQMNGFPRVIGVIDGCHIHVKTPPEQLDEKMLVFGPIKNNIR